MCILNTSGSSPKYLSLSLDLNQQSEQCDGSEYELSQNLDYSVFPALQRPKYHQCSMGVRYKEEFPAGTGTGYIHPLPEIIISNKL